MAKDMQFPLQNVQNEVFKILKMFENNMKFTKAARCINSKNKQQIQKHHTHNILFCHYCWSLLWCDY